MSRRTRFIFIQVMNVGWVKVWIIAVGFEGIWFVIPVVIVDIIVCRSGL